MDKIAIIDCGTNTFHLLIAEVEKNKSTILHKEKISVRIGKGGINKNIILPDAIQRATATIKYFSKISQRYKATITYAFATSAFRNATNGNAVKEIIFKETGIELKIISGSEEAELIFWGVNDAIDNRQEPSLVTDIGGGSVEFIIGHRGKILWKQSFEIGAQRLLDLFYKTDPITPEEIQSLEKYLNLELSELFVQIRNYQPNVLIGASGTFETLSDIYCYKHSIPKNENDTEIPLSLEEYYEIHQKLISIPKKERMKIPGMIKMRVDMIVVASCLINLILHAHNFQDIRVSTQSLKEGVLKRVEKGYL